MYKFSVNNKLITSSKTVDIGTERKITFLFDFGNVEFEDDDIFELELGSNNYQVNYSFINAGKLKFVDMNFNFIDAESTSLSIKINRNGTEILSDTLTIIATVAGGSADLSNYYTKQQTENLVNNNQLGHYSADNATDTIALAYNAEYAIQQVNLTSNNAGLTINPCTGYTAVAGKIPTFEMWIKADTAKTTISISNDIQQINADAFPETIATGYIYIFVWRFANGKQLMNYSHRFSIESGSSSQEA